MLFDPFAARTLPLANRMVMAPMTCNRAATRQKPDALMPTYCGQPATAGLIITEANASPLKPICAYDLGRATDVETGPNTSDAVIGN